MNITRITIILLGFFFLQILHKESSACDITFEVIKGEKKAYNTGDTITVVVDLILTRRLCPVAIKETKFKTKGLKVIKATSWQQVTSMKYKRKHLIVIGESKKEN